MKSLTYLKENEQIEFKRSTSELKEAVISIASMLNKHGSGNIYFGVRDNGEITGQMIGADTIRDISRQITGNIEPKIFPVIAEENINGKFCIRVSFKGTDIPYFAYGRAHLRVGDEDRKMSAKELENFIIEKNKDKVRWDSEVCPDAKLSDISPNKLKTFLKVSGLQYWDIRNSLNKLNLLRQGKLLNTAIILFGKKPQKFFRNAKLRCGVFATTDTITPIDMKDFEGDLFTLIQRAEEYIIEHINIGMRLEGFRRIDGPEIDKAASREAVINAFCHRDYYNDDSVHVAIFRDRLEIRSPGLLYGGLTIAKIRKCKCSERRNELLADMFHRVHFVERWGRGIKLILSKEPTADFEEIGRQFFTVLKRKGVMGSVSEKTAHKTTHKTVQKILDLIKQNPKITRKDLAKQIGSITEDGIKYQLTGLVKAKVIIRRGGRKQGYWEVLK